MARHSKPVFVFYQLLFPHFLSVAFLRIGPRLPKVRYSPMKQCHQLALTKRCHSRMGQRTLYCEGHMATLPIYFLVWGLCLLWEHACSPNYVKNALRQFYKAIHCNELYFSIANLNNDAGSRQEIGAVDHLLNPWWLWAWWLQETHGVVWWLPAVIFLRYTVNQPRDEESLHRAGMRNSIKPYWFKLEITHTHFCLCEHINIDHTRCNGIYDTFLSRTVTLF